MFQKLLCKLGIHKWTYNPSRDKRWCVCGKTQEYWCHFTWLECIDGEPIE